MGAFQNKAVKLAQVQKGIEAGSELALANSRLLAVFIDFYRATGGSVFEIMAAAEQAADDENADVKRVGDAMGDVMTALAVLGHVHDIDIIQAGYNTLETQVKELEATLKDLRASRM